MGTSVFFFLQKRQALNGTSTHCVRSATHPLLDVKRNSHALPVSSLENGNENTTSWDCCEEVSQQVESTNRNTVNNLHYFDYHLLGQTFRLSLELCGPLLDH